MDEKIEDFLKIITELGGYLTVEQAKALGLANSDTRVLAHLRGLERAGFLGNLKLTQKLLGHSNISTTADVYTHISEESEREAALTVEEAICGSFVPDFFPTGNKTSNAGVN
jgi:hypothetical protein